MNINVCKTLDDFVLNYRESIPSWSVVLNNNESIYQDDGRPNCFPASAWKRLKIYCEINNLYITNMYFGFRDNIYSLPSDKDGYFFSKGALGCFGSLKTTHFFIVGTLTNDILEVTYWKVPEMLKEQTETRNVEQSKECLITKNNMLQYTERLDLLDQTNTLSNSL